MIKNSEENQKESPSNEHIPIVIIGSGFGGVGMAIQLMKSGIYDFTILERANSLGGTWRDNNYPGCACDVPSTIYSYSFAKNPNWSRVFAKQPEILEYIDQVAKEHNIHRHIRFQEEILTAKWNQAESIWQIKTNRRSYSTNILITACGPFSDPAIPNLPGLSDFKGPAFHTARWDHNASIEGKRIAVIGTGASAVQVVPAIQSEVKKLSLFQRTPIWVLPRPDKVISESGKKMLMRIPALQTLFRGSTYIALESLGLGLFVNQRFLNSFEKLGLYQLRRQVDDLELRERLTPDYRILCKRPVISNAYYPAINKPNVDLVTSGIEKITKDSIVTTDGMNHPVDIIVLATGFHMFGKISSRLFGREGISLSEHFGPEPKSYLGTCFHGFPNLFMMMGPYAAGGNQSAIYMLESQMTYIVDAIKKMRHLDIKSIEPKQKVNELFLQEMQERSTNTAWVNGGCSSYYQNANGGNVGLWPNWTFNFRKRTKSFDIQNYDFHQYQSTAGSEAS